MQCPPRARDERLLSGGLLVRAYLLLGVFEAMAALWAFFAVLVPAGWRYGQDLAPADPLYQRATTACLVAIVLMQVVNLFCCRSATRTAFSGGIGRNRLIAAGLAVELGLTGLIVFAGPGQRLFGTRPPAASSLLGVLPFALGMLGLEELRKWLVRVHSRRAGPAGGRLRSETAARQDGPPGVA
jgi:magnesium-transporting ATPase (P-type)